MIGAGFPNNGLGLESSCVRHRNCFIFKCYVTVMSLVLFVRYWHNFLGATKV